MPNTHQKLMQKLKDLTLQYMEIGGLLRKIRDHEVYRDLKCDSFKEYLLQFAEISPETAYRWMRIHHVFSQLKFPRGLILGPTKMYLLSGLVTQENVTEMLRWANVAPSSEIRMALKTKRNRTLSLWLTEEEHTRVEKYIHDCIDAGAETKGDAAMFLFDAAMDKLAA